MKQLKKIAILAFSIVALSFIACSDDNDENSFSTQTVSAKKIEKGGNINEEVSISVSLSDSGKTTYAEGKDATSSFTKTSISMAQASSSVFASKMAAIFDTTATTSTTNSEFTAVVKSVSMECFTKKKKNEKTSANTMAHIIFLNKKQPLVQTEMDFLHDSTKKWNFIM